MPDELAMKARKYFDREGTTEIVEHARYGRVLMIPPPITRSYEFEGRRATGESYFYDVAGHKIIEMMDKGFNVEVGGGEWQLGSRRRETYSDRKAKSSLHRKSRR